MTHTGKTMLVAGVAGAFVAAAINLGRMAPATETAAPETGPFRMFTQNEAGRYMTGFDLDTQAGKPTASVFCFPRHPMIHASGKQVQLDAKLNQTSFVVRGTDGRVQLQPAPAELGTEIKAACTAIRRDMDASAAVNRLAGHLAL